MSARSKSQKKGSFICKQLEREGMGLQGEQCKTQKTRKRSQEGILQGHLHSAEEKDVNKSHSRML